MKNFILYGIIAVSRNPVYRIYRETEASINFNFALMVEKFHQTFRYDDIYFSYLITSTPVMPLIIIFQTIIIVKLDGFDLVHVFFNKIHTTRLLQNYRKIYSCQTFFFTFLSSNNTLCLCIGIDSYSYLLLYHTTWEVYPNYKKMQFEDLFCFKNQQDNKQLSPSNILLMSPIIKVYCI